MLATPSPMIRPPVISGPCPSPPNPTISRPMLTTTAAISMLAIVTSTLYPMLWPGMLNPSMATKCMPQTPAAPMDTAASSSQRTREAPCRARALQGPGPRGAPQAEEAAQARHDITQDRRQQPVRKVVDDHHQRQYPPWRGPPRPLATSSLTNRALHDRSSLSGAFPKELTIDFIPAGRFRRSRPPAREPQASGGH